MKIICTTPLEHLIGLKSQLKKHGELIYKPNIDSKNLKKNLVKYKINAIFCNNLTRISHPGK